MKTENEEDDWVQSNPNSTWKPLTPFLQDWQPSEIAKLPPDDDFIAEDADDEDELWVQQFCGEEDPLACPNCFSFLTWKYKSINGEEGGWISNSVPGCKILTERKRRLRQGAEFSSCKVARVANVIASPPRVETPMIADDADDELVCAECGTEVGYSAVVQGERIYYLNHDLLF